MKSKIKTIIKSIIPIDYFRYVKAEKRLWRDSRETLVKEAEKNSDSSEEFNAYLRDLDKHHVSFAEWKYLYNFPQLAEDKKEEFISRFDAQRLYRKFINPNLRRLFFDKACFLKYFHDKQAFQRKIIFPNQNRNQYVEELIQLQSNSDIIVKPISGTCGKGIVKIRKDESLPEALLKDELFNSKYIIEECIKGGHIIQSFHPSSLNTIRIVTYNDGEKIDVFYSVIRFGTGGRYIDNGHSGGCWCHVDVKTGTIDTDAIDSKGNIHTSHPDTKSVFKGLMIPEWELCCEKVKQLHIGIDLPFIGWDVCITDSGNVEIIEGNHAPDTDIAQSPSGHGIKRQFTGILSKFKHAMKSQNKISKFTNGNF